MSEQYATEKKRESIFLNEHFMAAACVVVVVTGLVSLYFCFAENDSFAVFELLTKLVTAASMYLAFRFFKWDVAKGLMGGVRIWCWPGCGESRILIPTWLPGCRAACIWRRPVCRF